MSITLATGTQVAIASTYGASVVMSALSNAAAAVATLAGGHGVIVGDFLEVTSGWDRLNGRIVRVSNVATNDITFESINTSSTSNYPAGSGTGTIRRITAWTSVTQIQTIDTGGGDLNFADITTVTDLVQKQVPTTRSPVQINFGFFFDPSLGWYSVAAAATESATATGMRIIFPNSSRLVQNGFYSLQTTPTVNVNAPLTAQLGHSASAPAVVYAT